MEYTNSSSTDSQNLNPNFQQQVGSVPPPPPSQQQVGIRSMESDLNSIQESGGEAPQSQIISAPEISDLKESHFSSINNPELEVLPQSQQKDGSTSESTTVTESETVSSETNSRSFSFKNLLMILGAVILIGAVGFGAYYLTSYLKEKPSVKVVEETSTESPVVLPESAKNSEPTTSSDEEQSLLLVEETPPPLVHRSLIKSPTKTEVLAVDGSLDSFKKVIKESSLENMTVGSIKDLSFVDSEGKLIESSQFLLAFWPTIGSALAPLVERDFTSWLYYDKVGGAKLGAIFVLKTTPSLVETLKSLVGLIEGNVSEISNFFLNKVPLPTKIEFKDGQIEGVAVRFLPFEVKSGNVFEYGWYGTDNHYYLIFATSYNQMLDIIKKIKTLSFSQEVIPSSATSSTSTNSTNSTSTNNNP